MRPGRAPAPASRRMPAAARSRGPEPARDPAAAGFPGSPTNRTSTTVAAAMMPPNASAGRYPSQPLMATPAAGPTAMPSAFIIPNMPMPEPMRAGGSSEANQVDMHTEHSAYPAPLTRRRTATCTGSTATAYSEVETASTTAPAVASPRFATISERFPAMGRIASEHTFMRPPTTPMNAAVPPSEPVNPAMRGFTSMVLPR